MNFKAHLTEMAQSQVHGCHDMEASLEAVMFSQIMPFLAHASEEVANEGDLPEAPFGERGYSVADGVATVKVRGLLVPDLGYDLCCWGITGYDVISAYIAAANRDTAVSQIILDIDSGGGFVQGLGACVDSIESSDKKVSTFASGNMYSAAYWLGCTPQDVACAPESGVGSIGVYREHFDRSEELANRGVTRKIFKSGFWKGAFSSYAPLSDREEERLQQDVDDHADNFFEHVSSKRGISKRAVSGQEGDAFLAEEALNMQLVDEIKDMAMPNDNSAAAAASAPATTEVSGSQTTESAPAAQFTQAQLDAAVADATAKAVKEANEKAAASAARSKLITDHGHASKAFKELLDTEDYASLSDEAVTALLDAHPKSFSDQMEEVGGAGVTGDNNEFAPPSTKEEKAEEAAKAAEALPTLKKAL